MQTILSNILNKLHDYYIHFSDFQYAEIGYSCTDEHTGEIIGTRAVLKPNHSSEELISFLDIVNKFPALEGKEIDEGIGGYIVISEDSWIQIDDNNIQLITKPHYNGDSIDSQNSE